MMMMMMLMMIIIIVALSFRPLCNKTTVSESFLIYVFLPRIVARYKWIVF